MTTEAGTPVETPLTGPGLSLGGPKGDDTREASPSPQNATEKRKATMRAQSYATGFRVGDRVTTNTPRSPKFHQRTGEVITTNLGEVGVVFDKVENHSPAIWFLPAELTRVTA